MKQSMFLNTLNWYCVKRTCFGISYSGSASSNASQAVRNSYTAHAKLFCSILLHGGRTQSPITFILQFRL